AWLTRATAGTKPRASAPAARIPRRIRAPVAPPRGLNPIRSTPPLLLPWLAGGVPALSSSLPLGVRSCESALTILAVSSVIGFRCLPLFGGWRRAPLGTDRRRRRRGGHRSRSLTGLDDPVATSPLRRTHACEIAPTGTIPSNLRVRHPRVSSHPDTRARA